VAGLDAHLANEEANTRYGNLLVAKLLLVGVAAMLGGFNRWCVMRPWLALEARNGAAPAPLPAPLPKSLAARFRQVLWVESLVLLTAVGLAAWLASTPPPGEQILESHFCGWECMTAVKIPPSLGSSRLHVAAGAYVNILRSVSSS
jgi:hypothetical protein